MFTACLLLALLCRAHALLQRAKLGDNVTLECFHRHDGGHMCWYRQDIGEQPKLLSYFYINAKKPPTLYNHSEGTERLSVHADDGVFHLKISNVQQSDSAVYYCGHIEIGITTFAKRIYLVPKESGRRSSLQPPEIESVQLRGSITLNCIVHPGACDGEHRVYWLKEASRDLHLGFMYVHESSGQCLKNPEVRAESCTFSLSRADAGMYYCAVASCGQLLLSKGARVGAEGEHEDTSTGKLLCVAAALLASGILNIILISVLCRLSRRKSCLHGGHHQPSVTEQTSESQNEECDSMQYVAVDFKRRQSKSRRLRAAEEETIYSGVALSDPK